MRKVVVIFMLVIMLAVMAGSAVSAEKMEKYFICHQDVDDDDPDVDQVPIWINGNALRAHFENHGDFFIEDAEQCLPVAMEE